MTKRSARKALKQTRKMMKELDAIQDEVAGDPDCKVWAPATAARWAVNALEEVLTEIS